MMSIVCEKYEKEKVAIPYTDSHRPWLVIAKLLSWSWYVHGVGGGT